MPLRPDETKLVGQWVLQGHSVIRDASCKRIESLIESELQRIAVKDGGWSVPYRDPSDGRLWKPSYPQSESEGGGPPALEVSFSESGRCPIRGRLATEE